MLFVAEYEFTWATLEAAIAKRLEWDDAKPNGFRFIGEFVWQDGDPPFRGVAIIEAETVDALNSFALHYGPALKIRVHPASDVVSAIGRLAGAEGRSSSGAEPRRRIRKRRR